MDTQTTTAPITITETALGHLKTIFEEQAISDNHGIRVGVKGGGCSGFSYVLGFDEKKEGDDIYEIGGFPVFMQKS